MQTEVLEKYNRPVPRYTSYPPANFFESMQADAYQQALAASNDSLNDKLSFYFHIPFCRHLCHYCGCNSYSMRRPEAVKRYVNALHLEIERVIPLLRNDRRIAQIHYGGGSPTAIPFEYLRDLNAHLLDAFACVEQPEIAIECHPGYLTEADWQTLCDCGFNRFSLGVQDLHADVLKTANRHPSLLPLQTIFDLLRSNGKQINLDFIYGLPKQTPQRFLENVEEAVRLHPDRLVTFSYAHVPWVNKQQLVLEKAGLPRPEDKQEMFRLAAEYLNESGYVSIGMDHFVLPEDELYVALKQGRLHRNFQGYCTRRTTAQVYAFGVTAISQLDSCYAQNTKDIDEYITKMETGEWAVKKGYILTPEQQITREVIESLMCNNVIRWEELAERLQLTTEEVKAAVVYNEGNLREMQEDGLITFDLHHLQMTESGTAFVRTVAASLDKMLLHTDKAFSKPV